VASQPRRALITGITGQDGSFLAELLLEKGYEVSGVMRGDPKERSLGSSEHLREHLRVLPGDLLDADALVSAVQEAQPDELYHLASPSFIPASWERPAETLRAIAGSTATLLEAARDAGSGMRVFVAASGAMFGEAGESPQSETTPCRPTTPYAVAKLASHQLVGAMRAHEGLWACSGIVFNHESERRPHQFVTRTITRAAAQIKLGLAQEVMLGDLGAVRDWSFAGDVMRGAWLALQQEEPGDYVLASGVGRTVAQLAHTAFACVGLEVEGHVLVDPKLVRAPERTVSVGDPSKARELLGWEPQVSFEQLVKRMVEADLRELQAVAGGA
jgi:GDPmannose 4,6-dehydratase